MTNIETCGVDDLTDFESVNNKVSSLLKRQIADGRQIGVQVCAYKDGEVVVDTFAGRMGLDDPRPVRADSLFLSWSTTKGVAATALHILADKGLIDYDAPVAEYWPEFAKNGKDKITVAQAMSHQGGLHAMPEPFRLEHLTDWDAGIKRMEEATPAWKPGTAVGYHAVTFSWIVGGIVHGATGKHIKDVKRDEIAEPIGVEDEMFVGIPDGLEDRLATLELWDIDHMLKKTGMEVPSDGDFYKAMPAEIWKPDTFNSMPVRKACLPSANGHFTARALAKMYAALSGDGSINGIRLVSSERITEMQRVVAKGFDRVLGNDVTFGIGFEVGGEVNGIHGPMGPRTTAFGHTGAGGSIGFADPEVGLAVAVTLNKMDSALPGRGRTLEICDLIRTELG